MIGWLRDLWPWLLGLGLPAVGVIALAFLNPAAALRLLSAVAGFVLDLAHGAVAWLRKPRTAEQRWRMACFALGVVFLAASFVAWDARQTIVVIREKCAADVSAAQSVAKTAKAEATGAKYEAKACRVTLAKEIGKREEIEALADKAVREARKDEVAAEQKLDAWQRQYNQRPQGCDAALTEMERQCAAVPNN